MKNTIDEIKKATNHWLDHFRNINFDLNSEDTGEIMICALNGYFIKAFKNRLVYVHTFKDGNIHIKVDNAILKFVI